MPRIHFLCFVEDRVVGSRTRTNSTSVDPVCILHLRPQRSIYLKPAKLSTGHAAKRALCSLGLPSTPGSRNREGTRSAMVVRAEGGIAPGCWRLGGVYRARIGRIERDVVYPFLAPRFVTAREPLEVACHGEKKRNLVQSEPTCSLSRPPLVLFRGRRASARRRSCQPRKRLRLKLLSFRFSQSFQWRRRAPSIERRPLRNIPIVKFA
jgi:hypothetical protein